MSNFMKAAVAVLLIGLGVLAYWTVNNIPDAPEPVMPTQHVMTYEGNKITETKDGKVIWEMSADSIEVSVETKLATMNNVKCKYYTEDGKLVYMHSDKAIYNQANDNVDLVGNIKMRSSDGYSLNCDQVNWTAKEQKLSLLGNVKMHNKEEQISASGDQMDITESFNKFTLKGHAYMSKDYAEIQVDEIVIPEEDQAKLEAAKQK